MITYESQRGRRILARVERNEALVETIERIARDHTVTTGFVEAVGVLSELTVSSYDAGARGRVASRRVVGPVELLSAKGTLASTEGVLRADLSVLVSKEGELGPVLVGGHLEEAEALSVDVVIHAFDDLGVRREREERSGLVVLIGNAASGSAASAGRARATSFAERIVEQEKPAQASSPRASGWAMAAAASAESSLSHSGRTTTPSARVASFDLEDPLGAAPVSEDDEHVPSVGDFVDHRQFGLCRVDRVGADGELLIRLETGRRKAIRIDVFQVSPPKMEGSKRVYVLRPRRSG